MSLTVWTIVYSPRYPPTPCGGEYVGYFWLHCVYLREGSMQMHPYLGRAIAISAACSGESVLVDVC